MQIAATQHLQPQGTRPGHQAHQQAGLVAIVGGENHVRPVGQVLEHGTDDRVGLLVDHDHVLAVTNRLLRILRPGLGHARRRGDDAQGQVHHQ